jgi:hypothetical protein
VTVAVWPAFTLSTSDSLSGTTSFIELRSLSTANEDELDEELLEPVAPAPAAAAPVPDEEPTLEELSPELVSLLVPPPETVSPTSPLSETIVPSSGASRRVSATACSSLLTVSRSLRTAAFAEAMFASRVAELMLAVVAEELEAVSPAEPLLTEDPGAPAAVFVAFRFAAACVVPDLPLGIDWPWLSMFAGASAVGEEVVAGVVMAGAVVVVTLVEVGGAVVLGAGGVDAATCAIDDVEAVAEPEPEPEPDPPEPAVP